MGRTVERRRGNDGRREPRDPREPGRGAGPMATVPGGKLTR